MKRLIAMALVAITLLGLWGCSQAAASVLEKAIDTLSRQEMTLEMGQKLKALEEDLLGLSEEQREKLKNLDILDQLMEKYEALEEDAIRKVEEQIAQLPHGAQIQEGSEEAIRAARKAWELLPEDVREKIQNIDVLEEAEKALDKLQ